MRAVQIRTFGEPGIVLELADLPEPSAATAGQGADRCRACADQHEWLVSHPRCISGPAFAAERRRKWRL